MTRSTTFLSFAFLVALGAYGTACSKSDAGPEPPPASFDAAANAGPDAGEDAPNPDVLDPERSVSGTWRTIDLPKELAIVTDVASVGSTAYLVGTTLGGDALFYSGESTFAAETLPASVKYIGGLSKTDDGTLVVRTSDTTAYYRSAPREWKPFALPKDAYSIRSLIGVDRTNFYVSREGAALHSNNGSVTEVGELPGGGIFYATGAGNYWFATGSGGGMRPTLYRFDGKGAWNEVEHDLGKGVKLSGDRGVAFTFTNASDNRSKLWIIRNAQWTELSPPAGGLGCTIADVWSSSANNAWAVGTEGCIFHWDGKALTRVASPTKGFLTFVRGTDPEHVWAATQQDGKLLALTPE